MKLHILLPAIAFTGLLVPAVAQIPNGGFEDWTTVSTYQEPNGWITFNGLATIGGGDPTTEQGTPGAVGSYFAKVTTRNTAFGMIQGVLITGDVSTGSTGFAYASRPAAFTGQWQYGIQPQDTGMVAVYFSKWNTTTQHSDSIGAGVALVLGSLSGWNAMNIPITYFSSATPDTAYIGVFSSMNSPVEGSFIQLDDLGFGAASGIEETKAAAAIRVFPSPATTVLNVVSDKQIEEVDLLDMTGRIVLKHNASAKAATVDLDDLNTGRYLVQLRMEDGTRNVRSFVKE